MSAAVEASLRDKPKLTIPSNMGNIDSVDAFLSQLNGNWSDLSRKAIWCNARELVKSMKRSQLKNFDSYGNDLKTIPNPNLSLLTLQIDVDDLVRIDKDAAAIDEVLAVATREKQDIMNKAIPFIKAMDDYEGNRKTVITALQTAYEMVKVSKTAFDKARNIVSMELGAFWHEIHSEFSCEGLQQLLTVVGMVVMFSQPELKAISGVYAAGGLLQAGAVAPNVWNNLDTANGPVKKELINSHLHLIATSVSKELKDGLVETSGRILKLSGGDKEFLDSIATERKAFTDLCNRYFDEQNTLMRKSEKLRSTPTYYPGRS